MRIKSKVNALFIFLIQTIVLSSSIYAQKTNQLIDIPIQSIDLHKLLNSDSYSRVQSIKAFQISELVTYKEYKEYLAAIKIDSSEKYYLSQLPDTNITVQKEVYNKYINSTEYDNFPVLGISWDNAMNFCRWKTKRDNPKDTTVFYYRLPHCSEWLAAYNYLTQNKINNDFNDKYSDWLINSKDESAYVFKDKSGFTYDYFNTHSKNDSKVLKRKFVIGNSYLFQMENLGSYYQFTYYAVEGYRQVAFRYVKENGDGKVYYKKRKLNE